jgi:hypothetical protein
MKKKPGRCICGKVLALHLTFERWRLYHDILAVLLLSVAFVHVWYAGDYVQNLPIRNSAILRQQSGKPKFKSRLESLSKDQEIIFYCA